MMNINWILVYCPGSNQGLWAGDQAEDQGGGHGHQPEPCPDADVSQWCEEGGHDDSIYFSKTSLKR